MSATVPHGARETFEVRRIGARVLEAALLALAGGLLARGFIGLLLGLVGDGGASVTATGLLLLIWPGLLNLAILPFGRAPLGAEVLLHVAFAVGALTGLLDGWWSIHRWRRWGLAGFVLDVTWGLPGSANALLLHLVNLGWGRHAQDEGRRGAHRYRRGFAPGPGFAFTLGSVMSNTRDAGPGSALFAHEMCHVWQSRLAGPFFAISYLGWQLLATPLAIVAALVTRQPVGRCVQRWAYYNNPWEIIAYAAGARAARGNTA